jgi:hypothetical protein
MGDKFKMQSFEFKKVAEELHDALKYIDFNLKEEER